MIFGKDSALLFLKLIQEREERRKNTTRCRLPAVTVRNLWNRELLTEAFLDDVQDWLLSAGWAFINAGSTFGAVKVEALKNWPRVASGRIKDVLNEVKSGKYDFSKLEPLMATEEADDEQEDE